MTFNRVFLHTWVLKTRPIKRNTHHFFKPNCRKLQNNSKNVGLKIGSKGPQKLGPFFLLFLMRKTLSSGQTWFLRPYFPLVRGMFLLRSVLRFSFRALEVPESRVRKRSFSLTKICWPAVLPNPTEVPRHTSLLWKEMKTNLLLRCFVCEQSFEWAKFDSATSWTLHFGFAFQLPDC